MRIYVAHSKEIDFVNELYTPLRKSALNAANEIILPHERPEHQFSRDIIKGSNLMVAEVSKPSTSLGIEIGWANAFGVPIIAIYEPGSKKPWWMPFLCKTSFEYIDPDDMVAKLTVAVANITK